MKVLSLFGGMECGRIALDVAGITVESYHSSEVDEYARKLSSDNYPDIVHIGSVTEVDGKQFEGIDLLIGGPPCQDLSIAGKRAGLVNGKRSSLFFEYVRILKESKPAFFLMENVASMKSSDRDAITSELFGIEPVMINSSLLSAQSRKRFYWFGKRNADGTYSKIDVPQPDDRGLVLRDILEDVAFDAVNAKGEPVWRPVPEKYVATISERIEKFSTEKKAFAVTATYGNACIQNHLRSDRTVLVSIPYCLNPSVDGKQPSLADRAYHEGAKGSAVTTCFVTNVVSEMMELVKYVWRKLTVRECARLQTIPDSYRFGSVSNSRAYKAIGNGWTVAIIAHILKQLR